MKDNGRIIIFLRNWMSNFHSASFIATSFGETHTFPTTEHYFMWYKAMFFGDFEIAERILRADNPYSAKSLGREVKNYNDEEWSKVRYQAMLHGNILKYQQNNDIKEKLLATGNKILAEGNPIDPIWGIGLSEDDPDEIIFNPGYWRGYNLLGYVLMDVRNMLSNYQRAP